MPHINLFNVFSRSAATLDGAVTRYIFYSPGRYSAPAFEKFEGYGLVGPPWRWKHRVSIQSTHVPRTVFNNGTTARWSLHLLRRVRHKIEWAKPETIFWFESDEDFLTFKLAGVFDGVLREHRKQKPEQTEFDLGAQGLLARLRERGFS